jgi:hypothetical protein
MTKICHQAWKSVDMLGLDAQAAPFWDKNSRALQSSHIRITDKEDELIWQQAPHGHYTPKLGYIHLNLDLYQREPIWWWKRLWKVRCPLKENIFMWCVLYNKVPT